MASTKFYLDLRGRAADGKGTILIQIFHNHSMTSISTGVRAAPNEWDGQRMKSHGCEAINAGLQEQKSKIDRAIAMLSLTEEFYAMTAADIKRQITKAKPKLVSGHLVVDLFNDYLNSPELKDGTKQIYKSTLKKIVAYAGDRIRIEQINLKWLRGFEQYLSKTQGINGRSIYLRSLRAICNYASNIGIKYQYPFDLFKIKQEETQKRCISVEDLRRFMTYPTSKSNSVYRDYFMLMFYLIGINIKDLLLAKKSQVISGRLEYIRAKTGKKYSIKIEPEAEALIDLHGGKGEYLLDALDHCLRYKSFYHQMNDAIKTIGPVIEEEIPDMDDLFGMSKIVKRVDPIIPDISTYYSRHTWATIAYEIGIPIDVVSQALGHSMGNRTTLIYVKPNQEKVDEANRRVIDYLWNG